MKRVQVDRGAIKFVLSGANIMCPGLTSAGGFLEEDIPADSPVVNSVFLIPFFSFLLCCTSQLGYTFKEIFSYHIFFCFFGYFKKAVFAEGKTHALAIGLTKMSSKEM